MQKWLAKKGIGGKYLGCSKSHDIIIYKALNVAS